MNSAFVWACVRGTAVSALFAGSVVDLLVANEMDYSVWCPTAVLAVGLAAVLWPAARRPAWLTPQLRTAVPALFSVLSTAASILLRSDAPFGLGEIAVLLCLLFIAVRHCPPRWAVACGVLDAGAVLAASARYFRSLSWASEAPVYVPAGLVLVGLTASLAAYLRSQDYRRTVAATQTRREERMAIAADLHDFVAHHVTGILVQTQMARMIATTRPEGLDPVLAGIEDAATEALASMRRTVGLLRDTTEEPDRRLAGDLAAIADLTEGFASPAQKVTFHRDAAIPDTLPHEVQAAAFRVAQEALTNVRRHAADATEIAVGLHHDGEHLEVTVCDDGRGSTQLPTAAHGDGFGLVGLRERVTALGGELHTGPRPGHGWQVQALFPAPER
jgi:signal transduction histidine kinase